MTQQDYAPNSAAPDEEIEGFSHELEKMLVRVPSNDVLLIMDDLIAKIK